ncbi:hypothetical protein [Nocardioides sp.]|uniref:hypothetical protein n=1 Tax=Nocardioides sp. TaxID=35761 RepID=UPI00356A4C43
MSKRLTTGVVAALVALTLIAVLGTLWWREAHRSDFQRAADLVPADSERLSWTDWGSVRDQLDVRLDADSSVNEVSDFLAQGYDADLTSTSALVESAPVMQARFGFSPATVDWEIFSQSSNGAVVIVQLPDGTDFDDLGDRIEALGYSRPSDEAGVWRGGDDLLTTIGPNLTPELQYLALDEGQGLVLSSDNAAFLDTALDQLGDGVEGDLAEVVDASADALSASVYDGTYTCTALAMSQADEADQDQAAELLEQAGKVNPIRGFAMSVLPGGDVRVAMAFENDDQAVTNADTRAVLVAGPAPGQGGDFTDRFRVDAVTAEGRIVRFDLVPREGAYVLSDLSAGPVLFAAC